MSAAFADALNRLVHVPGVRGAVIVDAPAGVPIVEELAEGVSGRAIAALASSLFRRTARAAEAGAFGVLHSCELEAERGHVIVAGGAELLVVALAAPDAQLGMIRLETNRAAGALQ
jgi:predicted regulator of Ras-like GTPase activity (Roadblock/LC7/MglB family)